MNRLTKIRVPRMATISRSINRGGRTSLARPLSSYNYDDSKSGGAQQEVRRTRIPAVAFIAVGLAVKLYETAQNDSSKPADSKPAAAAAAAAKPAGAVDYAAVREAIVKILDKDGYDDGSIGPVLVRLAWHASGTYDHKSKTGGSNGATMRYEPEAKDGANAGLDKARAFLEPVKAQFPGISYADLWTLAASVAIEEMGGPKIDWRAGRSDAPSAAACPPQGRLPDAAQGQSHIRDVFYRMGLNDQEIVALAGAHSLGRCHTDRSGFSGPWTRAPTTFSNEYFRELIENKWTEKKWNGPKQFEDPTGQLMMLPADLAFRDDPKFREFVNLYAKDQARFFKDFAAAWKKLIEFNVPAFAAPAAPAAAAPAPAPAAAAPAKDAPKDGKKEKSFWEKLFG